MGIISILLGILAIGILALVHEVGHYVMAKRAKIDVDELSIGVGPKIFSFDRKETKYSLRILPFFAYVKVAQEGDHGLEKASIGARFLLYSGGVIFNLLLGLLIFIVLGATAGFVTDAVIVGSVADGYPAQVAGLESGDRITQVDGITIENPNDFAAKIQASKGETVNLNILRGNENLNLELTPVQNDESKDYRIGIVFGKEKLTIFDSVVYAFKTTFNMIGSIFEGLFKMVTGTSQVEVAGPIGIVTMASKFTTQVGDYFLFLAILSISMGVFNLLPIPALDGGKMVFLGYEKISGKRVSEKVETYATLIGFGLLVLLLVYATFKDVIHIMGD